MKYPLVSVAILSYKSFEGIYKTLDSIFQQNYPEIELVICDDSSLNYYEYNTKIEGYIMHNKSANIKSVIMHHQPENVGTSKNCNSAIRLSHGKYFKLLPVDDEFYDIDVLSRCVVFAEEQNARIVIGQTYTKRREGIEQDEVEDSIQYRWKARSGRMCNLTPPNHDIDYLMKLDHQSCNQLIMSRCIISTVSVFFRKDLLEETGGFLETYRLVEDMPYWPYIAERGETFFFTHIIMVRYALNGISNGGPLNSEFRRDYCKIMENIYIKNEVRGGIWNHSLKKLRLRELAWMNLENKSKIYNKIRFWDVRILQFYKNVKYLLIGTKI